MSFNTWAAGVLERISAPVNATNLDTLWAWATAESGASVMRWNNPLNTTQPEGGGNVDANNVGVKIYPTEIQGIIATAVTLLNGYYPRIVDHLRRSVPRQQWSDCCAELGTWGTGCAWITRLYGAVPGQITPPPTQTQLEDDMATYWEDSENRVWETQVEFGKRVKYAVPAEAAAALRAAGRALVSPKVAVNGVTDDWIDNSVPYGPVAAPAPTPTPTVDLSPLQATLNQIAADLAEVKGRVDKALQA